MRRFWIWRENWKNMTSFLSCQEPESRASPQRLILGLRWRGGHRCDACDVPNQVQWSPQNAGRGHDIVALKCGCPVQDVSQACRGAPAKNLVFGTNVPFRSCQTPLRYSWGSSIRCPDRSAQSTCWTLRFRAPSQRWPSPLRGWKRTTRCPGLPRPAGP